MSTRFFILKEKICDICPKLSYLLCYTTLSKLIRLMEKYAAKNGICVLTIGVEAKEARTWAIYQHLGYKEFIMSKEEDGEHVLYYQKRMAEF